MVITEKHVEKYLVKECEKAGYWCLKFPPLFFRGFPDRIVLMPHTKRNPARVVFVEVKRPNEKPRLIQQRVIDKLRAMGFVVHVLDTFEAVDTFILTE